MKKSKKSIVISLSVLGLLALALIGVTYAYYRTRIYGNTSEQSLNVTSGSVGVKYNDNNASIITGSEITPGYIATKTFSVSNTGDNNVYFNIIFDNVTNGFNKGVSERGEYSDWVYRLYSGNTKDEDNLIVSGEITTASLQVLESNLEVKTGETNEYYLEIEYLYRQYVNQSADMGQTLSLRVNIEEFTLDNPYSEGTLAYAILNSAAKGENGTRYIDASMLGIAENTSVPAEEVSLENESIISYTDDDYTASTGMPSYYFRGAVEDNYVTFADMCWRIVRIEGNGNIKLILEDPDEVCSLSMDGNFMIYSANYGYEEIDSTSTTESTGPTVLKMNYLQPVNEANNSMVKEFYDFQNELNITISSIYSGKTISDYLSNGNWCLNDNAYSEKIVDLSTTSPLTTDEIESKYWFEQEFYYDSYVRLYGNKDIYGYSSTLKCNGNVLSDFVSVEYDGKRIIETAPMYVGAITADEVVYAGGKVHSNNLNYFLINDYLKEDGGCFWTLTPSHFYSYGGYGDGIFLVYGDGDIAGVSSPVNGFGDGGIIRPVIVLKEDITLDSTIEGQNGTQEHPYVIG